jgi:hypothetical protein
MKGDIGDGETGTSRVPFFLLGAPVVVYDVPAWEQPALTGDDPRVRARTPRGE